MAATLRRLKILIVILSVLLGISLAALAGLLIYGYTHLSSGAAVVPDNYIERTNANVSYSPTMLVMRSGKPQATQLKSIVTSNSANETVISIFKNHAEDSTPFNLPNMFPGDRETKAYLVEVSHKGTVVVHFRADVRTGYEKLAEVLKCKVVLRNENKTLYDGLMRDMPDSLDHAIDSVSGQTTELAYDITVYLDTSVGNDYMNKTLVADFRWWVEAEETPNPPGPPTPPVDPEDPDPPSPPNPPVDPEDPDEPDPPGPPVDPDEPDPPEPPGPPDPPTPPVDPEDPDEPGGELIDPPATGDSIFVWIGIALISGLVFLFLLLWKRRKEDEDEK